MSVVQRGFLYSLSLCCNAWLLWGCTTIAVPVRGQDAVSNLVARCEMEFRQGKTEQALATASDAIRQGPERAQAWNARGFIYASQGHKSEALEDFAQAVRLNRTNAIYQNNLGIAYLESGSNPDLALQAFNEALKLGPQSAHTLKHRGMAYRHLGRFEEALADLTTAAALDSQDATIYANRAVIYALRQQYREAKHDLDLAAGLNNALPEVYQSRGLVEMFLGRFDQAEKDFSHALALGTDDNVLVYNRGIARSILGNSTGAREDYERACREGYLPACGSSRVISRSVGSSL